jgi:hypothetical protein
MHNNQHNKNTYSTDEQKIVDFLDALRHVTLSKTEAQDMRERLAAYSDMHNAISAPIRSPFFSYFSQTRSVFSRASFSRPLIAIGMVLVILVGTTGVSYAAENSLPGQPLYAVKVSVVEPIQGALITQPVAKAQWQAELANRRLNEASTLAAQNNLGTSTQEYLANAANEHIALAQADASQLSASGNVDEALSVQSDLEAKLSAHVDFLSLITPRLKATGDATSTIASVTALLHVVNTDRGAIDESRKVTELALDAETAASSTPESASTTPAEAKVIAFVDSEDAARKTEETSQLQMHAALFRLLPSPATVAAPTTTTASTTASSTSTTVATTSEGDVISPPTTISGEASSTPRYPFYKLHIGF